MPTISTARGRIRIRIAKWTLGWKMRLYYEEKKKKSMNHTTRTTEIYSGRRECTRKTKQACFSWYWTLRRWVSKSFNQQKTAVLGPGRQEAGLFHLPVGHVAQDPVGLLPLPSFATPLWISQPQTTSRLARASSARGQGSLREAGRRRARGCRGGAEGLGGLTGLTWTDSSSLQHRHMLQSLAAPQRPPPAPPRPQSGAPGGPREPRPVPSQFSLSYPLGARPSP